jgi:hypothetical protein
MLPALADRPLLEARLGRTLLDLTDQARADAVLIDASTLVRSVAGATYVDDMNALVDDIPDNVIVVTLAAALRAFNNPDGYEAEQLDGYSYRASTGTLPGVYLTKAEETMLRRAQANVRTQRLERPGLLEVADVTEFYDIYDENQWVEVLGSDEPMPWGTI